MELIPLQAWTEFGLTLIARKSQEFTTHSKKPPFGRHECSQLKNRPLCRIPISIWLFAKALHAMMYACDGSLGISIAIVWLAQPQKEWSRWSFQASARRQTLRNWKQLTCDYAHPAGFQLDRSSSTENSLSTELGMSRRCAKTAWWSLPMASAAHGKAE